MTRKRRRRVLRIRVVERKLQRGYGGRGKLYGLAWADGLVELDPRQRPRTYMDTLIHECLHIIFPDAKESNVASTANTLTRILWRLGYRRVIQ